MTDEFRTPPRRPDTTPSQRPDTNAFRSPPAKKADNDTGFWIMALIFLLVGAWPISLIMLLTKFSDGKKKRPNTVRSTAAAPASRSRAVVEQVTKKPVYSARGIRTLKIAGIVLAVIGAMVGVGLLSDNLSLYLYDFTWLLQDMFFPAGFLCTGLGMLFGADKMKRRARRFGKYLACAGTREAIPIHQLALAVGVSDAKAERELELMVEKGLWGDRAYVDTGRDVLFLSPEAAQTYSENQVRPTPQPPADTVAEDTGYEAILANIRRANDRIDDPVLSEKIDRIEYLSRRIFRAIQEQPEKKDTASTFFNYYLPTTQKLLDSYADFEEAGVSGKNMAQAKTRIEATMDNIVSGFEHQLDELYRSEALDIDSDIRVMETLLRRDTSTTEDDFGLGGTAVQEQSTEDQ